MTDAQRRLEHLLANNRTWADRIKREDAEYFSRLADQQNPRYLWIGCSDSRVPANTITGLQPGEVFVHRNVANVVVHSDLNCLSVMQFAIDVLQVEHIIVCGHYGCGGVRAAMEDRDHGIIDNWLRHVGDVQARNYEELAGIEDLTKRVDRLCELNVAAQVRNVCQATMVRDAWKRGQTLAVHGWIYRLEDGLIRDMNLCFDAANQLPSH